MLVENTLGKNELRSFNLERLDRSLPSMNGCFFIQICWCLVVLLHALFMATLFSTSLIILCCQVA